MTQEELAEKTELSARTIQRIEKGEVDPRAYTLQSIARALDVDFSVFVEENVADVADNNSYWLGLLHLSGLLPLIFPTLIIWNQKKEKNKNHAYHLRAVISFQLCVLGICLGGLWVYWRVEEWTPLLGGLLVGGLVSVVNAIFVMSGKSFINPFFKSKT